MYARSWHRGPRFHGYDAIITSIKNMAMNPREIFRHTISFLFFFFFLFHPVSQTRRNHMGAEGLEPPNI